MDQLIEFPYCGGIVRVQVQAKAVIVNFFGQRFQFSATKAALRERVRLEIRKAGLSSQLDKIIRTEAATARKHM